MQQKYRWHYFWLTLVALGVLFIVLLGSGDAERMQYLKTVISLAAGFITYRLIAPRTQEAQE